MKILDIGCGNKKFRSRNREDKVMGMDIARLPGVDKVHNMEKFPWPFNKNEFEVIIANQVLEHVSDLIKTMEEIWRISKPNAIIKINVPFFAYHRAFQDPTHKRFFTTGTFEYFTEKSGLNYYTKARFEVVKVHLGFFSPSIPKSITKLMESAMNANQRLYERFFAHALPANNIYFELRTLK
jgi:ubiquinone/menaquinone biosynthesis C-methylase UbiE